MVTGIGVAEMIVFAVIAVLMLIVPIVSFWQICRKAGFSPWLALGWLVPIGGPAVMLFLAFSDWPALRRLEALEE